MNNLDKQYQSILQDILDNGVKKIDRTGTGTLSVFGKQITHNMSEGFPILTTKKVAFKQVITELLWFLRGDTNLKFLHDNGCHIWDGDYNKSGRTDNNLGPIYGKQWRDWNGIDQIQNLINELQSNPDSRRLLVNAWNVGELDQMVLPPCHYGFQMYTTELTLNERGELFKKMYPGKSVDDFTPGGMEVQSVKHQLDSRYNKANIPLRKLSLMWTQRSIDSFLGLSFNIASYGLLLEIIARQVNMIPDKLIGNLGDTHLYLNHIEQAKEQISRSSFELPTLEIYSDKLDDICHHNINDFELKNYKSHPKLVAPLSN